MSHLPGHIAQLTASQCNKSPLIVRSDTQQTFSKTIQKVNSRTLCDKRCVLRWFGQINVRNTNQSVCLSATQSWQRMRGCVGRKSVAVISEGILMTNTYWHVPSDMFSSSISVSVMQSLLFSLSHSDYCITHYYDTKGPVLLKYYS